MSTYDQHRARKRFGQNFLIDQTVLTKIASAINPLPTDHLVEIGPGKGALTEYLIPLTNHLDLIEIDRDLVAYLKQQLAAHDNVSLHQADVLNFDFHSLTNKKKSLRIVGNLPYNISTPLLFKLFDDGDIIIDMFFMLQKEVVERLTAEVGSNHYGRLSVMSQYHCDNELLFGVGPHSFDPAPKVDSAIVRLVPRTQRELVATDINRLSKIVKEAFTYRRKTLSNALKRLVSKDVLEQLDINPQLRPQDISITDYVRISNAIS